MNTGFVVLEEKRGDWIDQDQITKLDIFEITGTLLELYVLFMTVLLPIDNLYNNQSLIGLVNQLYDTLRDRNFFTRIYENILKNGSTMVVLLITLPGASCYTIGYRIAAFQRFLFNIVYKQF